MSVDRDGESDDGPLDDEPSDDENRGEVTVDDALEVLEDNDSDPKALLDHREIPYVLAEWLHNDEWRDTNKYQTVEDAVKWNSGKVMPKGRFTDTLEDVWDEMVEEEEEEDTEADISEMDPDEFFESFEWNQMKDREKARKCHFWLKENENIIYTNDRIRVYDDGVWVREEGRISVMLQRLLKGHHGSNVTREYIDEYVTAHPEYRVDWSEMGISGSRVAVANGLLDLMEGELVRELKPEDYAIAKIPVEWKGMDADRELWEDFVTTSIADQDRKTAQEYAGYTLHSNSYPYKKALMLLGERDNGKTVFSDTLNEVLGRDNVTNIGLKDLASNQFSTHRLQGSLANINAEIDGGEITETALLRALTGEDRFMVDEKFETQFDMENSAKLIFAANRVPEVKDAPLAFYERWLFVHFPHRFTTNPDDKYKDADTELAEKLKDELPGILAWMVEGYQRLAEQGHFSGQLPGEEIREQWTNYADTTATFVRNYVHITPDGSQPMPVDRMYEVYKQFIETTPTGPKSKQKLNRYITTRFDHAETTTSRKPGDDDEPVRVWDGVHVPLDKQKEIAEL